MTLTMPPAGLKRPVTGWATEDLEQLVQAASGRPCVAAGVDGEDWFPSEPPAGNHARAREDYEARAAALCRFCPVQLQCLELALRYERGQRGAGVWGGTSPWRRQQLALARRQAQPAPITILPDRAGPVPLCPACSVVLDGGPVVFICSGCGQGVMAADVSAERTP